MPAYVIVDVVVEDPKTYERYKELAPPSIRAYGGRYVGRGGATRTLEGTWSHNRLVILEFPSIERAEGWLNSAEYAPARALRHSCARTQMVAVEGLP